MGDLQQCSHTKESRVKNHIPTEQVFPWDIGRFEEKMKLHPDSLRELQRQFHSSQMEIDHTNLGYETSRREWARLHEELAQREGALRVRSIHEVEELKGAQEM